jgi:hypothetical protein
MCMCFINMHSASTLHAGIQSPKLTQAYFGDLRGAAALDAIPPNEPFVTVPRSAAIVVDPRARCPCPEYVDQSFWKEAPWSGGGAVCSCVRIGWEG